MSATIIPNGTRVSFTTSCIDVEGNTTERTDYGTVVDTTAPYETAVRPMRTYGVIVDSDDEWNATHPLTFMADRLTVVEETSDVENIMRRFIHNIKQYFAFRTAGVSHATATALYGCTTHETVVPVHPFTYQG
jgi:hypothetical protein